MTDTALKKTTSVELYLSGIQGGGWGRLSQYPNHLFSQRGKQEDGSEKAESFRISEMNGYNLIECKTILKIKKQVWKKNCKISNVDHCGR